MSSSAVGSASSGMQRQRGIPNLGDIARKKSKQKTVGQRFDVNDRINLSQKAKQQMEEVKIKKRS